MTVGRWRLRDVVARTNEWCCAVRRRMSCASFKQRSRVCVYYARYNRVNHDFILLDSTRVLRHWPILQLQMTSKRKKGASRGGTAKSLASTRAAGRKAASPIQSSSDSESEENQQPSTPAKKARTVLEITPGAGVHIWNRKGDGPKYGLTKEALDLWLQPRKKRRKRIGFAGLSRVALDVAD